MNSREDVNYSGFSRKSVVLAALGLALVAGALAVFFCFSRMETRQQEVLRIYEQRVNAWLIDAVQAVKAWDKEMTSLRLRVSGAETYRLFAGDLFGCEVIEKTGAENFKLRFRFTEPGEWTYRIVGKKNGKKRVENGLCEHHKILFWAPPGAG